MNFAAAKSMRSDTGRALIKASKSLNTLHARRREAPDIVITDIVMEPRAGEESAAHLARRLSVTPIVSVAHDGSRVGATYLNLAEPARAGALKGNLPQRAFLKTVETVMRGDGDKTTVSRLY